MKKIYYTSILTIFITLSFAQVQQNGNNNLILKKHNGIKIVKQQVKTGTATLGPSNNNRKKIEENHNAPKGEYIEGKLFFQIRANSNVELAIYDASNAYLQKPQYSEGFSNIMAKYKISKLTRPFIRTKSSKLANTYLIEFPKDVSIDDLIMDLEKEGFIEYAEKLPMYHINLTPNDPQFGSQYYLPLINAETAWDISTGSTSIKVAVLDNAFRVSHEDLANNIWTNPGETPGNGIDDDGNGYIDDVNGFDVANNDPDLGHTAMSNTKWTHGTHVAGLVSASSNNSKGIASIGYNLSIIPVKITNDAANYRDVTHYYQGMLYAININADVVNMSFGGSTFNQTIQNLMDFGAENGILWIAAAGNDNVSTQSYPAAYDNVISVAASDATDKKASFSNYGSWVDVTTPGKAILSLKAGSNSSYGNFDGTSMACPITAGLAGLMKSHFPAITVSLLDSCLVSTTVNIDALNTNNCGGGPCAGKLGSGRINALAAMNCVSSLLAEKPKANFKADVTSTLTGVGINFTDLSIFAPTGWAWSFPGAATATSSAQNPGNIIYNTPGTYDVTLIATNANGNDTMLKTNYITINPTPTCDSLDWWFTSNTLYDYTVNVIGPGPTDTTNGKLFGHHPVSALKAFAERFSAGEIGTSDHLLGVHYFFSRGDFGTPDAKVIAKVWSESAGLPNTIIAQQDIPISTIQTAVTNTQSVYIDFGLSAGSPVNLSPADLFIGFEIIYGAGDSVALYASATGYTGGASTIYVQDQLNVWMNTDAFIGPVGMSGAIFPKIGTAPTSNFAFLDPTTGCSGMSIELDNTSTNSVLYNWLLPGGDPTFSTSPELTVRYDTSGTYDVTLLALGSCGDILSKTVTNAIQVYDFNVTEAITDETCDNDTIGDGAIDLTVSGDNPPFSFTWAQGDTTEDLSGLRQGAYQVAVLDAFGCSDFFTYNVGKEICPGIKSISENAFEIYPNPTTGNLSLVYQVKNNAPTIAIYDLLGKRVQFTNVIMQSGLINIAFEENLRDGLYLIKLSTAENNLVKKIKLVRD